MHVVIFMSDRVPKAEKVKYAYVDVVRKQHERRQLDAFACAECEAVISNFVPLYHGGGIQLPLKWLPDSSVSSLIRAG